MTDLTDGCWTIATSMLNDTPVAELDALTATVDERDFEAAAQHVRAADVERNRGSLGTEGSGAQKCTRCLRILSKLG